MTGWNVARALAVIRLKDPGLRPWLRYILLSQPAKHLIEARLNTTVQRTLNLKDIKELSIPVPPKYERNKIAEIFTNLESKPLTNSKINKTLEQISQSIFKSWFVDFDPVKAKIAAIAAQKSPQDINRAAMSAISGKTEVDLDTMQQENGEQYDELLAISELFPTAMQESAFGKIPAGWEISTIGNEVTVVGGGTPSTKNSEYWHGEFSWITPKDLSGIAERVLISTERKITAEGVKKISSGQLPVGTVLLSSRAPIGYLAITMIPVSINQGFIAMVCNKRLPNTYVLQWAVDNLEAIKQRGSGTTFAEISKANFRLMRVIVPQSSILDAFNCRVITLYEQITAKVQESEKLGNLRGTMLPKLLAGEIRLIINDNEKNG